MWFLGGSAFGGAQRLGSFPEDLAAKLAQLLDAIQHGRKVVARGNPALLANAVGPYGNRISVR